MSEKLDQVKDYVVGVNEGVEENFDPLLVKWAKAPYSGLIAVGVVVVLPLIGFLAGKVL